MSHFSVIRCDFPGCDTVTKPGTTANPQFKEVWICTADTRAGVSLGGLVTFEFRDEPVYSGVVVVARDGSSEPEFIVPEGQTIPRLT